MKLLAIISVSLVGLAAHAADFYECGPFADVEEYRAGIDMKLGKAGFFDNDTTSIMQLESEVSLESNPPQRLLTYRGDDLSYDGTLQLQFNETRMTATMISIDSDGKQSLIGEADCVASNHPWDLEE